MAHIVGVGMITISVWVQIETANASFFTHPPEKSQRNLFPPPENTARLN